MTVRKHGTTTFMLPGGKPERGESPLAAARRECLEELGIVLDSDVLSPLGVFDAPAVHEPGQTVTATVFEHPAIEGRPHAEIAEIAWAPLDDARVAPLLRDAVFPALRSSAVRAVP